MGTSVVRLRVVVHRLRSATARCSRRICLHTHRNRPWFLRCSKSHAQAVTRALRTCLFCIHPPSAWPWPRILGGRSSQATPAIWRITVRMGDHEILTQGRNHRPGRHFKKLAGGNHVVLWKQLFYGIPTYLPSGWKRCVLL